MRALELRDRLAHPTVAPVHSPFGSGRAGEPAVGIKFPSAEWTLAFRDAINANAAYAAAGKDWTHGKVAYVVKARPSIGIDKDTAMVLDLHAGKCREAQMVGYAEAQSSDFVIVAEYERWKEVLSGAVDPTKAMMQN